MGGVFSESDAIELMISHENILDNLEKLEKTLAERYSLREYANLPTIREQLTKLDHQNKLIEDQVVADWHEHLSIYKCLLTE